MAELFLWQSTGFWQRPAVLLADGKNALEIEFPAKTTGPPSFVLQNARQLRARLIDGGRVQVRCIPEKGASSAKILFLGSEALLEIPLTVAPPISIDGIAVEAEELLPKLDLDGDGQSNWRDDYILVANLLARAQQKKTEVTDPNPAK